MKIHWEMAGAVIIAVIVLGVFIFVSLPQIYNPNMQAPPGEPNVSQILRGDVPDCNNVTFNVSHPGAYCKFNNTDTLYCKVDYNTPTYFNEGAIPQCRGVILE